LIQADQFHPPRYLVHLVEKQAFARSLDHQFISSGGEADSVHLEQTQNMAGTPALSSTLLSEWT
jgi:hypothetical protein